MIKRMLLGVALLPIGLPSQRVVTGVDEATVERIRDLVENLKNPAAARAATHGLLRIGRQALPVLRAAVFVRGRVASTDQAERALAILGSLGPDAGTVYADLVAAYPTTRGRMFLPVVRAMADLVPYTGDQGHPQRLEARILDHPGVGERLQRGNDRQRFQYEFNRLHRRAQIDPEAGRKAMIEELGKNRTHCREVAAEVLGRMGPAAKDAVPALVRAMAKRGPVVGQVGGFRVPGYRDGFLPAASRALLRIAPADPRTAVAWGHLLNHSTDPRERRDAVLRLGSFGAAAKGEIDTLVDALRDPDATVRAEAVTALGMIGPPAVRATYTLQQLVAAGGKPGGDKALAARAAAALSQIRKPVRKQQP